MRKLFFVLTVLLFSTSLLQAQVRIKMKKENGVYTTPCKVNGLQLRFIFDTGASNVSLSLSEAIFMLKNGYLDESDLQGSSYSQIANGDIVKNTTITLRELEIGGIKLHNIEAIIIHELSAPLLLGQSAIQKLGKIQMNDDELIIISSNSPLSEKACSEAQKLIEEAEKYESEKLYALTADTYQRAYDLCPNAFSCLDLYFMGSSYNHSNNYQFAIKYLEKVASCTSEDELLYWVYQIIGESYVKIKNYNEAILNIQKAIFYATDFQKKSSSNSSLAEISLDKKRYHESISYLKQSVEFYLKYKSLTTNDVMRGKVQDGILGEHYYNIALCYYRSNSEIKADNYVIKAALCGEEVAIEYCKNHRLNYKSYIIK